MPGPLPVSTGTTQRAPLSETSTPPEQLISLALSPPTSAEKPSAIVLVVLRLFRAHREGNLDALWSRAQLPWEHYIELQNRLKEDEELWGYVEDKVRYDYDPEFSQLIVRMTTPTHDLFIVKVEEEIKSQLKAISSSPNQLVAEAARKVERQGTSRILLTNDMTDNSKYPKHSPDAAFRHEAATYPGVVIEVSYSQKRKDLPYLAENYIIGSQGSVRAVVGLDIEYYGSKKATVSVWRPKLWNDGEQLIFEVEQTVDSEAKANDRLQLFRNEYGSAVRGGCLTLQLKDFVPSQIQITFNDSEMNKLIEIPYNRLAEFLITAVEAHEFIEEQRGFMETLPQATLVRKRRRTPPEELRPDTEAAFRAAEKAAEDRMEAADEEWGKRRKV
ncbi:hypothetical protein GP486_007640 [Trichoglossum hirsutum]|uniref:Uncharacterized protein n=1 Tax=Trichoglossum hirsutum TaxID=265104 RepID=A0A9P8I5Z8_9PEZI|nr:hypothetical protein GP486_007640 [Trichoglossum hirsutum]